MQRAMRIFLLSWLFLAFYSQSETGLADNSDFSRIMTHFTSGPIHLDDNWPDQRRQPEEWRSRFFSYWIPQWRLDFPEIEPSVESSVILLWYPGVIANYLFYSKTILSMKFVALFPWLLLFGTLWLLLRWIEHHSRRPILTLFTLALPLTLLISADDYTIFLNSFYAETASLVYGFGLVVALLYLGSTRRWRWFAVALLLTALLITAKASYIYLVLVVPLLVMLKGVTFRPKSTTLTLACMLGLLLLGSQFGRNPHLVRYNSYNSLFYGILPLSEKPQQHLETLGIPNAGYCIDKLVYTFVGGSCQDVYGSQMRFSNSLRVLVDEPELLITVPRFVADEMHVTNLSYLGRRSESDLFAFQWKETHRSVFNLWPQFKSHFPAGASFYLVISTYLIGCYLLRRNALAKIGLFFTLFVLFDMAIAFFGDGKQELTKHLLFANWQFDIATIFLGSAVATWVAERVPMEALLPDTVHQLFSINPVTRHKARSHSMYTEW